jgi:GST-like protein
MNRTVLYGVPGWGSVLVEAMLAWCGTPYEFVNVEGFDAPGAARDVLAAVNPLAQVPTLVLEDGSVLTESAAIALWLAETHPDRALAPAPGTPARAQFLRRLIWFAAAVYPTFTYADYPERFAPEDARTLAERALERRRDLWRQFEAELGEGPWVLGATPSVLDVYVAAMTRWQPRRDWFEAECPKLHAVAQRADGIPRLRPVWERNFPGP